MSEAAVLPYGVALLAPTRQGRAQMGENLRDLSDPDLMRAYSAGNNRAMELLFQRYSPTVLRMMRQGLFRPEDAQDLVQQTFLNVHKARHDFRPGAPFRPWLLTIAYNLKREYFRKHKVRKESVLEVEPVSDANAATDRIESSQNVAEVRAALADLPESQREVIAMHWFEELSFPEIAEIVGASLSAVKVRAHRGYTALRKKITISEGASMRLERVG